MVQKQLYRARLVVNNLGGVTVRHLYDPGTTTACATPKKGSSCEEEEGERTGRREGGRREGVLPGYGPFASTRGDRDRFRRRASGV